MYNDPWRRNKSNQIKSKDQGKMSKNSFTNQADLIIVQYSVTITGLASNSQFNF
jgi:hypothetical protein